MGKTTSFDLKSRYTLVRDPASGDPAKGASWRIADRVPSFVTGSADVADVI